MDWQIIIRRNLLLAQRAYHSEYHALVTAYLLLSSMHWQIHLKIAEVVKQMTKIAPDLKMLPHPTLSLSLSSPLTIPNSQVVPKIWQGLFPASLHLLFLCDFQFSPSCTDHLKSSTSLSPCFLLNSVIYGFDNPVGRVKQEGIWFSQPQSCSFSHSSTDMGPFFNDKKHGFYSPIFFPRQQTWVLLSCFFPLHRLLIVFFFYRSTSDF